MSMPNPNPQTPWYLVTEHVHYLHGQLRQPGERVQYVGQPGKFLILLDGPNGKPVDLDSDDDAKRAKAVDAITAPPVAAHQTSDPRRRQRPEAPMPAASDAAAASDAEAAAAADPKAHRRDPRGAPGTF